MATETPAKQLTDQQVIDEIRNPHSLRNKLRVELEAWANRREIDSQQRRPMSPIEMRRDALEMAEKVIFMVHQGS